MKKGILSIIFASVLAVSMLLTGCAGFGEWYGNLPTICDSIPEGDSVLCKIAGNTNVRLEDMGNVLIVANAVALGNGLYTKAQYDEVINSILDLLGYEGERSTVTYSQLRLGIYKIVGKYPGLVEIATIYLDMFINQNTVITSKDREILTKWLAASLTKANAI